MVNQSAVHKHISYSQNCWSNITILCLVEHGKLNHGSQKFHSYFLNSYLMPHLFSFPQASIHHGRCTQQIEAQFAISFIPTPCLMPHLFFFPQSPVHHGRWARQAEARTPGRFQPRVRVSPPEGKVQDPAVFLFWRCPSWSDHRTGRATRPHRVCAVSRGYTAGQWEDCCGVRIKKILLLWYECLVP